MGNGGGKRSARCCRFLFFQFSCCRLRVCWGGVMYGGVRLFFAAIFEVEELPVEEQDEL